jgi:hypothetical protein
MLVVVVLVLAVFMSLSYYAGTLLEKGRSKKIQRHCRQGNRLVPGNGLWHDHFCHALIRRLAWIYVELYIVLQVGGCGVRQNNSA